MRPPAFASLRAILKLPTIDRSDSTPSPPSGAAIDEATLERLREDLGGDDSLRPLIASFLGEAAMLLKELAMALSSGEAAQAQRANHTLESTSLTFGASRLAALARECEALRKDGRLSEVSARLPRLELLFAAVQAALAPTTTATV